ncbi:MAG: glycosyltransferase family 1 protein [Acidipila sp.]|nr:glycosyltransferase family 1 protein [Acidipila sp.]
MTRHPIRVLHVLGSLNPGGVETWLINILRHMDRERFEMQFCTFGPEPGVFAPEAERLGGRVIPCPKGKNVWSLGRRFRGILREGRYDVVHSHVHYFSGAVLRWAQLEGVPMRIAHSHTTQDDKASAPFRSLYREMTRAWIHRYATHGLGASRGAAAGLFGDGWERDIRLRVLYYGIDLKPFEQPVDRAEVRREFGIPLDAPVIGHVGRFVEAKNHAFLLEIAHTVLAKHPTFHFLLVGDGPLRPAIEARARSFDLYGNIHFAGARHDVPRLMLGGMNLFLFPSIWEGLPIALLEAQAAGLPCVVSDSVSGEVQASERSIHFLPLTKRSYKWADDIILIMNRGLARESSVSRCDSMDLFSIEFSARELADFYSLTPFAG